MVDVTIKRAPVRPVEGFTITVSIDEMKLLFGAASCMSGAFEKHILGTDKSTNTDMRLYKTFGKALDDAGIDRPRVTCLPTLNPTDPSDV